jgi:hypothetical protein
MAMSGTSARAQQGGGRDRATLLALIAGLVSVVLVTSGVSATTVVYLDFDGYQNSTYLAADRRIYDVDVPPSGLDPSAMEDIRRRIAEDFAPFAVQVVTGAEPSRLDEGFSYGVRVAIGGNADDWGYAQRARLRGGRDGMVGDRQKSLVQPVYRGSGNAPIDRL